MDGERSSLDHLSRFGSEDEPGTGLSSYAYAPSNSQSNPNSIR